MIWPVALPSAIVPSAATARTSAAIFSFSRSIEILFQQTDETFNFRWVASFPRGRYVRCYGRRAIIHNQQSDPAACHCGCTIASDDITT